MDHGKTAADDDQVGESLVTIRSRWKSNLYLTATEILNPTTGQITSGIQARKWQEDTESEGGEETFHRAKWKLHRRHGEMTCYNLESVTYDGYFIGLVENHRVQEVQLVYGGCINRHGMQLAQQGNIWHLYAAIDIHHAINRYPWHENCAEKNKEGASDSNSEDESDETGHRGRKEQPEEEPHNSKTQNEETSSGQREGEGGRRMERPPLTSIVPPFNTPDVLTLTTEIS